MQIDKNHLKFLIPINQLQSEHCLQLVSQSDFIDLMTGDELSADQAQRGFLYLLKGQVELLETDHAPLLFDAQDKRALYPLFNEDDSKARFIAQSTCVIARLDKSLFNALIDQEIISADECETAEMNEVEGVLFNEIMRAYNMGELKLPSLPEIAVKVKKALASPFTNADDVSRIIAADPAMAARLISAANGPLNRAADSISSIQAAVVRLGVQTSRDLVTSFAIKQLFNTKSKLLSQRMYDLYDPRVEIAAIGFALSKQSGKLLPDHIMLAGLLHNIGVIPILSYIDETGLDISDEAELNHIINRLKGTVGSMVIRHWELPDDLLSVVDEFENWQRDNAGEIDACDMIIIAQVYYCLKHHQLEGLPKIEQIPAFKKLYPKNQDADFAKNVFQQAHEEITAIMQLLKM